MSRPAHIVFLLHMHQPMYLDPRSGRALLPWVRLHGARGYLDVARLLAEYEKVRLTVNFVPSLIEQLQAVAQGSVDEWLHIAEREDWTPPERAFITERFFSLNFDRAIGPRPRYRQLWEQRARREPFSDGDLRDLTVLFNLGWIGFAARENDRELGELEQKGRGYCRADLALVVERQRAACRRVLELYRQLSERGQIELSSSPYYHPIAPLLIDTEHARRALPHATLPSRFAHPDDAVLQIERGVDAHARAFGRPPRGMWPPEGSISPEAVAAYASAGIGWLCSDEGNLWRSLQLSGEPHGRGDLYRPWRFAGVDLLFRDREISDKIGFAYAHGDAEASAGDLMARARACADQSSAPASAPAVVPIFLDGENPWETYVGSGEPFLRALFGKLSSDPQLTSAKVGEHLDTAGERRELRALHSGSWIDSDFHIWIADPVKNRAWELLGDARARWSRAKSEDAPQEALDKARTSLLAAEGSDWFWWFGEPFHSQEDALFDELFRAHLVGAYAALGAPVPRELAEPVAHQRPVSDGVVAPYAFIHPRLGGHAFYDWQGAGRYRVPRGAAMAESPLCATLLFGFDREQLYLRVDPAEGRSSELAAAVLEVEIGAGARRLLIRAEASTANPSSLSERDGDLWRPLGAGGPVARGERIELAVPFERLALQPGERVTLTFRLFDANGTPLARYPSDSSIQVTVPGDAFEAENWSA
jgi:alpha-amylase/alpha-mannosidase (GH57 family)